MAIVHESSSIANGNEASGGDVTVPAPTGIAAGDVLLAQFQASVTVTTTSGFVLLAAISGGLNVYYRVAGPSEPASYTFTLSSGAVWEAGISRYSGVDNTTPFDVATSTAVGSFSTTLTVPGVTTVTANAMVVGGVGFGNVLVVTPPAALTERYDSQGVEHASGVQAVAGATGNETWTFSGTSGSRGWLTALRPGAVATFIAPAGVPTSSAVGAPTVAVGTNATITPTGVASASAVGSPTVAVGGSPAGPDISPVGVASRAAVGVPTVSVVTSGPVTSQEVIYTWLISHRSRSLRLVFSSTQPATRLTVRGFEVWSRPTGRQ